MENQQSKMLYFFNLNEFIVEGRFKVLDLIGRGTYGQVYKCSKASDPSQLYAIKVYPTKTFEMKPEKYSSMKREVDILKKLKHPNICALIEFQIDTQYYYLIQEYCNKNNLAQKINEEGLNCGGRFKYLLEADVIKFMQQLIDAFRYMHTLQKDHTIIVHRDIKLENIFVHEIDGTESIKLGDFGFARETQKENLLDTFLGSPFTQAPEISIFQKYDERADIYSLGVIFYQMLFGDYPYITKAKQNKAQLLAEIIKTKPINFKLNNIEIQEMTKVLLTKMITFYPKNRITFLRLFEHPYFTPRRQEFQKKIQLLESFSHIADKNDTQSDKAQEISLNQNQYLKPLQKITLNIQFIANSIDFSSNFIETFIYQIDDEFQRYSNWRKSSLNPYGNFQKIEEEKQNQPEEEKSLEYYQQLSKKIQKASYIRDNTQIHLLLSPLCEKTIPIQFDGVWREKQIFILLIDFEQDFNLCIQLLDKWIDIIDTKVQFCKIYILVIKDSLFDNCNIDNQNLIKNLNQTAVQNQSTITFIEQKNIENQLRKLIDQMFSPEQLEEISKQPSNDQVQQSIRLSRSMSKNTVRSSKKYFGNTSQEEDDELGCC